MPARARADCRRHVDEPCAENTVRVARVSIQCPVRRDTVCHGALHVAKLRTLMRLHPTGKFDNSPRAYRHIEALPLAAAMGAEICGVDAARVSDEQFRELRDALFRHKMIYLRRQKLTHDDQERFSLRFGSF